MAAAALWGYPRAPLWCSPVPAPSTDTRADPASARRAAGPARGRVGRAGGPLWCGPSLGAWGLFRPERLPTYSRLIAHFCSNNRPRTSLLLRAARVLATPASTAEGPRSRAARAAERPAAPVRLGRGGEPPGLISPIGVLPCSRARQAPAPGSMLDPHDDTDVPSGSTDGAQMESTSFPVPRERMMPSVGLPSGGLSY